MMKKLVYVAMTGGDHGELHELYAQGLIGAWNGAYEADGTAVLRVEVVHPRGMEALRTAATAVLLPAIDDPDAVATEEHLASLPVDAAPLRKAGLDGVTPPVTGRQLARSLHDRYKDVTAYLDPDL